MSEAGKANLAPASRSAVFRRAALWLALLVPFFYASYGLANWLAARCGDVGSIVFGWENAIPFVAWTILPYWSINAFYALSLFVNDTPRGVDRLAGRYLTAQLVAVACFIAFPLTMTFVRPQAGGLPGFLFDVLGGFDKPFNQAPSLHIALLVIIWDHLRRRLSGAWRMLWHLWCALIGLSVLTTWQHHFIDIPTGALLGVFALWLFPREAPAPLRRGMPAGDARARRLGTFYAAGAALLLAGAAAGVPASPLWLLLVWPALALAAVALAYLHAGVAVFQKRSDGSAPWPSRLMLWPYRAGAWVNRIAWTRAMPAHAHIADGVHIGRFPTPAEAAAFAHVVDLSAEFVKPRTSVRWSGVPMLDLMQPSDDQVSRAAALVEVARRDGPVLVCCALGFQRSAVVICAWLLTTNRAADADGAAAMLAAAGRRVVSLQAAARSSDDER